MFRAKTPYIYNLLHFSHTPSTLWESLQGTGFIIQKVNGHKNLLTPSINSLLLSHSDTHCNEFLFHVVRHLKKQTTDKPPEWHSF